MVDRARHWTRLGGGTYGRGDAGGIVRVPTPIAIRTTGGDTTVPPIWTTVKHSLDACPQLSGHVSNCLGDPFPARPALAGRQVRRAAQRARRVRAAHPGRARLRPDQPARHRQQLAVQPWRPALLLRRQARAGHLQHHLLQDAVHRSLRPGHGGVDDRAGAPRRLRGQAGRDDRRGVADASALVRPADPEHVRRPAPCRRPHRRHRDPRHDLADRQPLRRAGRPRAGHGPGDGVRRARRAVRGGAARRMSPATRRRCPGWSTRSARADAARARPPARPGVRPGRAEPPAPNGAAPPAGRRGCRT